MTRNAKNSLAFLETLTQLSAFVGSQQDIFARPDFGLVKPNIEAILLLDSERNEHD